MKARAKIWGEKAEAIQKGLESLDAELADLIIRVAYDDIFEREGLDLKTKELLAIVHLMHLGGESELKTHLYGALNCGASLQELKEVILHAAMFVGFPRALTAMKVLKALEKNHQATPNS